MVLGEGLVILLVRKGLDPSIRSKKERGGGGCIRKLKGLKV